MERGKTKEKLVGEHYDKNPMIQKSNNPVILSIDTSCDETAAAVIQGVVVLSNIIWSQAAAHAEFGGVMPSLAARMHKERIDWVVEQALRQAQCDRTNIDCIAVTVGPGLAIALGVGIEKAKQLANELNVPLYGINHIEGHLLSPLAEPSTSPPSPLYNDGEGRLGRVRWPALGLAISGGHTELVYIEKIGKYKILAETQDDALGEALDKAARMLGLGYPGGAVLEKMARLGNPKAYPLPLPMARHSERHEFSYSGLKTALLRLIASEGQASFDKQKICDLAATFQNRAFQHLERVVTTTLSDPPPNLGGGSEGGGIAEVKDLLVGGGVVANMELRKRLRRLGKELGLKVHFPYSKKLIGDNAAMIGIAAGLRLNGQGSVNSGQLVDRRARWSIEEV